MLPAYTEIARSTLSLFDPLGIGRDTFDYWRDTLQRSVLYLDVMRERGNQYLEHMEKTKPNVLGFDAEVLMDGRDLPRPVNYELMRIVPPQGITIDPDKRPFVVVDPRAGHGPGIGGFKPDSEIGVALRAGHPCYFIGFLPFPVPGQTVEDVADAEIVFMREVAARHPDTVEKPVAIGNCQAGWQLMMAAALEPDVFGPILIAGAPLSYWSGERGKAPMRYAGGMNGGSWMTAFAGDLGAGLFDGAWLVQNFENLNPANTLWTKQYRLFANIDSEAERYLNFERWWGGHVVLGADEIQYIVDNLFIGNRLSTSQLSTRDGRRIDLRNIRSPIVVFCSRGDDITPPPQALGWVRDLYADVDDIQANEQTIVYCVHDTTGHLGIFVSGSVSRREHTEFTANMDYIDVLPPGLYETAVTETATREDAVNADGDYLLEFSPRDLDDLDEIVHPIEEDDRRFATVARVSDINLGIYQMLVQPWMQAIMTPSAARWIRRMHPIRLGYKLYSDRNPLMVPVPVWADWVRKDRHAASDTNPWRVFEGMVSHQIEQSLDGYREVRDQATERTFLNVYGQPWLQTMVGLGAGGESLRRRPGIEPEHRRFVENRKQELCSRIDSGGPQEAVMRALIFILGGAPSTDERNFQRLKATRSEVEPSTNLAHFKALVRDQFFILKLDRQAALDTIPHLLSGLSNAEIDDQLAHIDHVLEACTPMTEHSGERYELIKAAFNKARQPEQKAIESKPAPKQASPKQAAPKKQADNNAAASNSADSSATRSATSAKAAGSTGTSTAQKSGRSKSRSASQAATTGTRSRRGKASTQTQTKADTKPKPSRTGRAKRTKPSHEPES
ncbi:DUF3141 domain-containing protein [Litchfieldella xinjiangensis]|uniref:DUF3141 domain-containing protein n=1 Tax=Litchfieldella xinjiangensis TaxID=1166948 RepID=UPI0005BAB5A0|nr:DUF3141 domain-containing protein [Halomonas xinjiangensis]